MNLKNFILLSFCLLSLTAHTQTNQILAGQQINVNYTDIVPDIYFNCSPPFGGEGCGPVFYHLDINGDTQFDYKLEVYHSGLNGLSYTIYRIHPYGNNMVLADTLHYTNPFGMTNLYSQALPIDSGQVISDAGLFRADSILIHYIDSNGFDADSIQHLNRHFVFLDTIGKPFNSFFLNIPASGFYPSMWTGPNDQPKRYIGLKFFTATDTLYGWISTESDYPNRYYAYACTGDTASHQIAQVIEESSLNEMYIYPNPARTFLNIQIHSIPIHAVNVSITDLQGKVLFEFKTTNTLESVNLNDFTNGLYLINFQSESKKETHKLLIIK